MNIGIITVYDSLINYGSFLQAYALKNIFEELGHNVYFIENKSKKKLISEYVRGSIITDEIKTIRNWVTYMKGYIKISKIYYIFRKDWKRLNVISKKEIDIKKLDILICGSDEIWNLKNKYVATDFYFGKDIDVEKIGFAISTGETNEIDIADKKAFSDVLNSFKYIAARDSATEELLGCFYKKKIDRIVDPTVIVGKDKLQKEFRNKYGKYILVYAYDIPSKFEEYICRFAKENDLKILTPVLKKRFADYKIDSSALFFGSLVKNAKFVYTSTFHGSIFSILNYKNSVFYVEKPKTKEVIFNFGVEEHILNKEDDYECFVSKMFMSIDKEIIDNIRKREEDKAYDIIRKYLGDK